MGFIGIRLTCDPLFLKMNASSSAISIESLTPSINAYSNVIIVILMKADIAFMWYSFDFILEL